ncbi:MAG: cation transporter, partial [Paracoccaceae bacterium]
MSASCGHSHDFDGVSADYKRRLWAVIAINAAMFAVEMAAGQAANSKALQADALDFLADALTYGLSLAVIGMSLRRRATVALAKAASLLLMGLWVGGSTVWAFFATGHPVASTMGWVGALALAANVASVLILARYKDG